MTNTITDKVTAALSNISSDVNDAVINVLVEQDKNKRVESIVAGLSKVDELTKSKNRLLKGDIETFNVDGELVSSTFSKERITEKKKISDNLNKWNTALSNAIDKGDMSKLYDLLKAK